MSAATSPLVTVEQYEQLPEEEWQKYELSEGELVPRYGDEMGARLNHNSLRGEVEFHLRAYLKENQIGTVVAEQDFRLDEGIVRRPDVSVILNENASLLEGNPAIVPGAPDLAIEILSPGNPALDVERKVRQLRQAGCRAVWLIFAELQMARAWTPMGLHEADVDDVLNAPDLLPGFKLGLRELFESSTS